MCKHAKVVFAFVTPQNTLVENDRNFSAVNIEAMYLTETITPIHKALLTYHNVY
jgi:hypothetical protein